MTIRHRLSVHINQIAKFKKARLNAMVQKKIRRQTKKFVSKKKCFWGVGKVRLTWRVCNGQTVSRTRGTCNFSELRKKSTAEMDIPQPTIWGKGCRLLPDDLRHKHGNHGGRPNGAVLGPCTRIGPPAVPRNSAPRGGDTKRIQNMQTDRFQFHLICTHTVQISCAQKSEFSI